MATIQLSGFISHIRGSIAGTTFQSGQSGLIARKKPIPVGKGTIQQSGQRVIISTLNREWENLSDIQRNQWLNFANYTNGAGKTNLQRNSGQTGKTQFVAVNSWLLLYNKPLLQVPSLLPPLSPIQPYYTTAFESDNLGKTVQSFDPTQEILVTRLSLARNASVQKSNLGYRTLVYNAVSGTTQDWTTQYVNYFGVPLVTGYKYWISLKRVNFVTGQMSTDTEVLIKFVGTTSPGIGYMVIGTSFIVT